MHMQSSQDVNRDRNILSIGRFIYQVENNNKEKNNRREARRPWASRRLHNKGNALCTCTAPASSKNKPLMPPSPTMQWATTQLKIETAHGVASLGKETCIMYMHKLSLPMTIVLAATPSDRPQHANSASRTSPPRARVRSPSSDQAF